MHPVLKDELSPIRGVTAEGWTRNLSAKIKESADAKVTKAAVTKEVTKEASISERHIVEANAEMMASVIHQRTDIKRAPEGEPGSLLKN